jgi:hypothetical protein
MNTRSLASAAPGSYGWNEAATPFLNQGFTSSTRFPADVLAKSAPTETPRCRERIFNSSAPE